MKKISIPGILAGGAIDIVSTAVLSGVLTICIVATLETHHASKAEIQYLITTAKDTNPVFRTLHFIIGHGCSVFGGFVSAKIARNHELINGTLASAFCFSISIYVIASGKSHDPMIKQFAELFVCPLLGLLGGYICLKFGRAQIIGNSGIITDVGSPS